VAVQLNQLAYAHQSGFQSGRGDTNATKADVSFHSMVANMNNVSYYDDHGKLSTIEVTDDHRLEMSAARPSATTGRYHGAWIDRATGITHAMPIPTANHARDLKAEHRWIKAELKKYDAELSQLAQGVAQVKPKVKAKLATEEEKKQLASEMRKLKTMKDNREAFIRRLHG
jgi:hypothetical protein